MLTTEELIDAYVADVARLLPRSQREDVAAELRALLREELAGSDDPLARLRAFGRPGDVAARYGQPSTVVDPADGRRFVRLTVIGVVVIWLLGAISADGVVDWYQAYGIAALWWPGFLVVAFGLTGWARRRWPARFLWRPRKSTAGFVNRPGRIAAFAFWTAGAVVLVSAAWLLERLGAAPQAVQALTFDPDFARFPGPLVLALLVAELAHHLTVTIHGRWRPVTRDIDVALGLLTCAALIGVLFAGPVYLSTEANQIVKFAIAVIVAVSLVDLLIKVRRRPQPVNP
ncbi:hypothetical protein DFJ67_0931 [Asanoa ferruginea]|uniref:Uncharacterized protein n=1 Tax=Asanoa ferruginea TaxID=53367 RepID=A0A3D9ZEN6_9ACTN|nr:hypothetical protein [Asanoa ferruginea]REF94984.1 hypothetical protein DFJ67_0931 [Asanoa ferruginea]GIF48796.1 hypothetical protein Afe04nite_33350 [Asanoa ferruginea]